MSLSCGIGICHVTKTVMNGVPGVEGGEVGNGFRKTLTSISTRFEMVLGFSFDVILLLRKELGTHLSLEFSWRYVLTGFIFPL